MYLTKVGAMPCELIGKFVKIRVTDRDFVKKESKWISKNELF